MNKLCITAKKNERKIKIPQSPNRRATSYIFHEYTYKNIVRRTHCPHGGKRNFYVFRMRRRYSFSYVWIKIQCTRRLKAGRWQPALCGAKHIHKGEKGIRCELGVVVVTIYRVFFCRHSTAFWDISLLCCVFAALPHVHCGAAGRGWMYM